MGYDGASRQDSEIHLRRKGGIATIHPDGTVTFSGAVHLAAPKTNKDGADRKQAFEVAGDDEANFDALFLANTPNKRNLTRQLYEIGL